MGARIIIEETDVVVVNEGEQGIAGPEGPAGPPGGPVLEFAFSYGDATPSTLFTALAGKLVKGVSLFIEAGFNGSGAALSVGSQADPEALLAASENDPTTISVFHSSPNKSFGADTPIFLFITPGVGASEGHGLVAVEMEQ